MTPERCSGGIAADRTRSAPRNATPNPDPPTTAPSRNSALEPVADAATISSIPTDSATEPSAAPSHGRPRPNASWATAAEPARANTATPATRWLVVWKSEPASCGPSERKSPPIDQEESTPSAARKNGRRATDGTLGRCGVRRRRVAVGVTGSGIRSAPASVIANSTASST